MPIELLCRIGRLARHHCASLTTLAAAASCSPGGESAEPFPTLPIRYETPQLRIGTSYEEPLCGRDFRVLDAHVSRVEDTLGVAGDQPETLFLYRELPVPGCADWQDACFNPAADAAAARFASADHELVHAIDVHLGDPADFWNEGVAEALTLDALVYRPTDLMAQLELPARELDYPAAGHFVRWLIDWGGNEAFLELFASDDFDGAYGLSLAEIEALYHDEAAEVLPPASACDDPPLQLGPNGSLDAELEMDCADPAVSREGHGYESGFIAHVRTLDVAEDATFSVRLDGGFALLIGGCQSDAGPHVEQLGDVVNETVQPLGRTYFEPGVEHEVRLPAFTYRIFAVARAVDGAPPARLRITRL